MVYGEDLILDEIFQFGEELGLIVDRLKRLGLSDYEARIYSAAVIQGYGTAEELAVAAGIPRTSSYRTINSLIDKGFIKSNPGRPIIYEPTDILETKRDIGNEIEETFDLLEQMQENLSDKGNPRLVFSMVGKDKIAAKLGEDLSGEGGDIFIIAAKTRGIREILTQSGIEPGNINMITRPGQRTPRGANTSYTDGLVDITVTLGKERTLFIDEKLSTCLYMDSERLTSSIKGMAEALMNKGED